MKPFILLVIILFNGCTGTKPMNIGIKEGKLTQCPKTPNCVCSEYDQNDAEHYIQPIVYSSELETARVKLKSIIESLERTKIIKEESDYIYSEFTSKIMRFVDDVEFRFDDSNKQIHIRSASRIGRKDFGVNRKRIENIRSLFLK
ncbi:MAG: DUF1499 domain-containing protein [Leptospiraceae bacterium]|nr:DUF1499 domain-containing protein [Leptospiraceae bacterium]MCP5494377.1 DUF1499 domain-containing protein [Leptospiraceae bacterium]